MHSLHRIYCFILLLLENKMKIETESFNFYKYEAWNSPLTFHCSTQWDREKGPVVFGTNIMLPVMYNLLRITLKVSLQFLSVFVPFSVFGVFFPLLTTRVVVVFLLLGITHQKLLLVTAKLTWLLTWEALVVRTWRHMCLTPSGPRFDSNLVLVWCYC